MVAVNQDGILGHNQRNINDFSERHNNALGTQNDSEEEEQEEEEDEAYNQDSDEQKIDQEDDDDSQPTFDIGGIEAFHR